MNHRRGTTRGWGALPVALLLGACHPAPAARPPAAAAATAPQLAPAPPPSSVATADSTLYGRLGGEAGMQAITAGLGARIASDGRINPLFADTDLEAFKANFAKFLAQLCGGPVAYHGPDMKTVHTGLAIANAQFDALLEDLGVVLDARQVTAADRAALLARLEPLRGDIVAR